MSVLYLTAVSIAFFHALLGPDHYLPFIALSKTNKWSDKKTLLITILCGIAHCLSSVFIGFLGIIFGFALSNLEFIEGFRGNIASYLLVAFGLVYLIWSIKKIFFKKNKHVHAHNHGNLFHTHEHAHTKEHSHFHEDELKNRNVFWAIFIVFLFGPCEPLIPILMYPAAQNNFIEIIIVAVLFTLVTLVTMVSAVFIGLKGLTFIKIPSLQKYADVLTSLTLITCGVLIIMGF